jgi:hypothetical protein
MTDDEVYAAAAEIVTAIHDEFPEVKISRKEIATIIRKHTEETS